ncbi:hypothetical protein G6F58_005118 [Rhizopus delemar]|nr:hypothetical protein G6F58_005118 [Rhizopus delemar]
MIITTRLDTPPPSPLTCFSADTSQLDEYNIICSPAKPTKLFSGVSWVVLYEIGRFMQQCKISWNEVPFDAFHTFLNTGATEPKKLFEVMMRWNTEKRLGQKITGLAYSRMDKCPDNVWSYIQAEKASITTQNIKDITPLPSPISASSSPTGTLSGISINNDDQHTQNSTKRKLSKNRMVRYSAIVYYKTINHKPRISLRPPKIAASNRLFRKFGQDRFLEITTSNACSPSMIRHFKDFYMKPLLLMQRVFRFLFIKDATLVFFATEGIDLEPISIQQVIDWHLPITENWAMTMSKYVSRMSLGYSSSIPTIQFEPDQIEYIDDIYSTTAKGSAACMTDGCGIISCAAMKEIMGCQTTDELPCAVQGRIGGAKGIWIISPDLDFNSGKYIKIRKSQNKFKTGLPQSNLRLDPHHYTFDLVKNSICVYPSFLNTQFIQVLAAGGVPTEVFNDILKEYIHRIATVVTENQSVKVLRDWVTKTGKIMSRRLENEEHAEKGIWKDLSIEEELENDLFNMDAELTDESGFDGSNPSFNPKAHSNHLLNSRTYDRINEYSGYPCSPFEAVVRLLDSGFDLSNAFIASRVTFIFRQVMKSVNTKYKVEVAQSCTVTCIPDPTGTLEPGEVFLQLSTRKVDERTGVCAGLITGDVIVTRNPCGLKSDVQKVKAIDCPALRMYTDLIIFSVKGDTSLASKLGGGDYDGDLVYCCWDQRIVEPFKSSPVVKELKQVYQAFEQDKTTVGQQVSSHTNTEKALQMSFISAQIPDGTLGLYENWRTVLAERTSLDDPNVSYLAQMCARLVDAPKQGLRLKKNVLEHDRNKYSSIPHPTWFMDKKNKQREGHKRAYKEANDVYTLPDSSPCVTTMDNLYRTLLKETEAFTRRPKNMFSESDMLLKDPDLIAPWNKTYQFAAERNDESLRHDLNIIQEAVNANLDSYFRQIVQYQQQRQHLMDNVYNPGVYVEGEVTEIYTAFSTFYELEEYIAKEYSITPDTNRFISRIIKHDLKANGGRMLQCLKASYAYIASTSARKHSKYCYIVAFDNLRRIKADAHASLVKENGLAETVTLPIYKSLNVDRKWIRKIRDSNFAQNTTS